MWKWIEECTAGSLLSKLFPFPDLLISAIAVMARDSSYARHQLTVSPSQLSALSSCGDLAFIEPLTITCDGMIIEGYARWELCETISGA
jgi:hypothetical protein